MHAWLYVHEAFLRDYGKVCAEGLRAAGVEVSCARGDRAEEGDVAIALFDRPDDALMAWVRGVVRCGGVRVVAVGAGGALTAAECWRLLDIGVADVMWESDPGAAAASIRSRLCRWHTLDRDLDSDWLKSRVVGGSPVWRRTLWDLIEAARFTSFPVLIQGESGTGKESAARLIHHFDPQGDKKELVVLDCTTIVPELSGSELFGHERGSFTGAVSARDGAFAQAHGGTLFLDEVGELPLPLQAQLLRVIQEKTYKRVGGNAWYKTHFRLVCATNRDLAELVRAGKFRADLYYRIAGVVCTLPPLRERLEDILPLVHHFMAEHVKGGPVPEVDQATRDYLLKRAYPGNVRELRQVVARLMVRHVGGATVSAGSIALEERQAVAHTPADWQTGAFEQGVRQAILFGVPLKEIGRAAEDIAVRLVVHETQGSLQQAAHRLGVTDRALQLRRAQRNGGRASSLPSSQNGASP